MRRVANYEGVQPFLQARAKEKPRSLPRNCRVSEDYSLRALGYRFDYTVVTTMKPSLHHAALNALQVAVVVLDESCHVVFGNDAWLRLFQHKASPLPPLGTPYELMHLAVCGEELDPAAKESIQAVLRGTLASYSHSYSCEVGDETHPFAMTVTPLSPEHSGCVIVHQETSEQRQHDEDVRRDANHDPLTGLPNRWLFLLEADKALALASRSGQAFALLYLDLDGFKAINDTYGHAVGDEVLRQVAARLKTLARDSDLLARQGGDEFLILLQNVSPEQSLAATERYRRSLGQPFKIHDVAVSLQGSFGIARYPDATDTLAELVQCADQAMYRAKAAGSRIEVC